MPILSLSAQLASDINSPNSLQLRLLTELTLFWFDHFPLPKCFSGLEQVVRTRSHSFGCPQRAHCARLIYRSSITSTVERGNAFEERSLKLLEQTMSMSLKRVGGKEDGGIDLLGWWWLPHDTFEAPSTTMSVEVEDRRRIRVVGQCKAEKKKMGP